MAESPDIAKLYRLIVDTGAMQHPKDGCKSAKSYAAHLTGLCCGLEYKGSKSVRAALQRWPNGSAEAIGITSPTEPDYRGMLTIRYVYDAANDARLSRACMNGPSRFGRPIRRSMKVPEAGSERQRGIEQIERCVFFQPVEAITDVFMFFFEHAVRAFTDILGCDSRHFFIAERKCYSQASVRTALETHTEIYKVVPIILKLLASGEMCGYPLVSIIKERAEGLFEVAEGTLYPVFYRLEDRGFIESYRDNPNAEFPENITG